MIIGRLLTGIGIGISSAIVPLYISEVYILLKFTPFWHYFNGFTFFPSILTNFWCLDFTYRNSRHTRNCQSAIHLHWNPCCTSGWIASVWKSFVVISHYLCSQQKTLTFKWLVHEVIHRPSKRFWQKKIPTRWHEWFYLDLISPEPIGVLI